ncbi:MAG: J domain-containing protein, partial [Acetobacteraceae bacterium]
FQASVQGATERLTLPDGQVLDVKIPPGVVTGQVLRLRGQGGAGRNGGPAGDALIELEVAEHPHYRRDGMDLRLELPVTTPGGIFTSSTCPSGRVSRSVAPWTEAWKGTSSR